MGWPASSKTRASSRPMAFGPVGAWPMFGISFACALAEESFCAAATPQRAAMISVTRNSLRIFYSPKTSWWRFMMRDYKGGSPENLFGCGRGGNRRPHTSFRIILFCSDIWEENFSHPNFSEESAHETNARQPAPYADAPANRHGHTD